MSYPVDGGGQFSAFAALLPFIEQQNLYDRIDFHARGFSLPTGDPIPTDPQKANNIDESEVHVATFVCPSEDVTNTSFTSANSNYAVNYGWPRLATGINGERVGLSSTNWAAPNGFGSMSLNYVSTSTRAHGGSTTDADVRFRDITDGLSNTAAFSELLVGQPILSGPDPRRVIWWDTDPTPATLGELQSRCMNLPATSSASQHHGRQAAWIAGVPSFGNHYCHLMPPNSRTCVHHRTTHYGGVAFPPSSQHPGGVTIAMADGSVRFVSDSIDSRVWWAMGSRGVGEPFANE